MADMKPPGIDGVEGDPCLVRIDDGTRPENAQRYLSRFGFNSFVARASGPIGWNAAWLVLSSHRFTKKAIKHVVDEIVGIMMDEFGHLYVMTERDYRWHVNEFVGRGFDRSLVASS